MSDYTSLSKDQLVQMVTSLEGQLRSLYLEKRFREWSKEDLMEYVANLESQHEQMVSSMSEQLASIYQQVDQGQKSSGSVLDVFKLKAS